MRARFTRARWTRESRNADPYHYGLEPSEELDLSGGSLWDSVSGLECRKQTTAYASTCDAHANGEVWVHWEDGPEVGSDRYQPLTEQGVRVGGCRNHNHDRCWSLGEPFPRNDEAVHVVVGPLSRLAPHRNCEWAATMGQMHSHLYVRTMAGSVGEDRCCGQPFALTRAEQAQITAVAAEIASVMSLKGVWVRNFDLIVGWRLFGVYDGGTRWPGFTPTWDLDPAVLDCWMVQLALQELA